MDLVPAASIDHGYSIIPTTEEPAVEEVNKGAEAGNDDPPVDWFEPLEEDDDTHSWEPGHHVNRRDEEEEEEGSVAAESEKSGSVASDDKAFKRTYRVSHHRKSTNADEGWVDWPILGEGWKRRQVIRRSGSSVGQRDVYYVGPGGERVRSRVELAAVLGSVMNVAMFDFKTGEFHTGQPQHPRRKRRKSRERQWSESSCKEKDEGVDTPGPHHLVSPQRRIKKEPVIKEEPSSSGKPNAWPPTLFCAGCGNEFIGTSYDRQRKKPCCPNCWAAKRKTHPSIRTKRWIPCLRCEACLTTSNCGSCHNCEDKLSSLPNTFTRLTCQKRRCLCPVRKELMAGSENVRVKLSPPPSLELSYLEDFQEPLDEDDVHFGFEMDVTDQIMESSDTEHSVNIEVDDAEDDMSDGEEGEFDEDDEEWPKRRRRRACGTCSACLGTTDCGKCDFCRDKPKFGGRNTKRQKCRLRQCQSRAKLGPGRRKPRYTYSRKPLMKRSKELPSGGPGGPGSPGEDDGRPTAIPYRCPEPASRSTLPPVAIPRAHWVARRGSPEPSSSTKRPPEVSHRPYWVEKGGSPEPASSTKRPPEVTHRPHRLSPQVNKMPSLEHGDNVQSQTIPQVFSSAERQARLNVDPSSPLYKLLEELRAAALPILWYSILVEGPRLQIIQCSKQSRMADTAVLIEPDFCFRVTVQKQPLLPCHPLYDQHALHLSSVRQVVKLLLDLESYFVCQGIAMEERPATDGPIILDRALTCDFLVPGTVAVCAACSALCGPR
ncbi:methyl-CpG-binding domain protein 1b isoform X2 [Gadus morhua]|uniref:methyl-CpG-binding domain protein 1b isoform X2 n=1 Tax=Gadus morhua TaxID=8049 RepID=UPI0011B6E118|nr:methyl-CpG-binding domain protein 1-like isoform X2 [Gadus morhua]